MSKPPRYALRCAQLCYDRRGVPRDGTQWVHIYGSTLWVCSPCAEALGRWAGIPTAAQQRRQTRERERGQQLPLDTSLADAEADGLEEA